MHQKAIPDRSSKSGPVGGPTAPLVNLVPKVLGADVELGNFVLGGRADPLGTGNDASRMLLAEIHGVPHYTSAAVEPKPANLCTSYTTWSTAPYYQETGGTYQAPTTANNPQDRGRKFLQSNGGCVYIDLDHLELCLPEVRSAYDFVAAWHAMLLLTRRALEDANERLPDGQRIQVLANNSDGQGNSWGGHLNFLIARRTWESIIHRKLQYLGYLASFQASGLILSGQGKVGAENYAPPVPYQIAQRADFLETICSVQTTYRRPLVNSRDEPLCGIGRGRSTEDTTLDSQYARLHCICHDTNLCQVASFLKVGMMQVILAMLEADCIDPRLILDDPVDAALQFSHDPPLRTRVRTANGRAVTAVELQLRFLDHAVHFCSQHACDGIIPQVDKILALYADTLEKLHAGDLEAVTGRLDWVLKQHILQRAMAQHPGLDWESPQIKHLDHLYSSLDSDGLFWAYKQAGVVEQIVSDADIERFLYEPPDDTRAWTRAMLLRTASPQQVESIDWDEMRFRQLHRSLFDGERELCMADPLGFARIHTEDLFDSGQTLEKILDALGATVLPTGSHQPSFTGGAYHEVPSAR